MKRFPGLTILVLALALVFGSALNSMAADTAGRMIDDSTITAEIKAKLAKDVRLGTLTGIEVNTTHGIVTLAGKVKSTQEKMAVEEIVNSVEGVKKINDNLQVVS